MPAFPLPALARLSAQAQLGSTRETVLACFLAARLVVATLPPYRLQGEQRRARADAAMAWLSALALPPAVRPALVALGEAASGEDPTATATALATLRVHAGDVLDDAAAAELDQLVRTVGTAAGESAAHAAAAARRRPTA